MTYTRQEDTELNNQLMRWQKRQLTAVRKNNIDTVFEKMNDIERAVWENIAKATSHKDVNYLVWDIGEYVISKYCKLAR